MNGFNPHGTENGKLALFIFGNFIGKSTVTCDNWNIGKVYP